MIQTTIILGTENNFPVCHKLEGLAKSEEIAKWLFKFCGWKTDNVYPDLAICIETVDWPEGGKYFSCDMTQLWVLGDCMYLN